MLAQVFLTGQADMTLISICTCVNHLCSSIFWFLLLFSLLLDIAVGQVVQICQEGLCEGRHTGWLPASPHSQVLRRRLPSIGSATARVRLSASRICR